MTVKREFSAKIADNFKDGWLEWDAKEEGTTTKEADIVYNEHGELDKLAQRISGHVVTLTENTYPQGENDFFEKEDNNFVIPGELFTEVEGEED